ncbi:hypothetical protein [Butyrivibrio fibrisolvens]|uniref:hypothetical protein n=1 Tax=Butyrivibrio fibrisolvens TaxID=831 RepID=UPI0012BC8F5B|nr:hypothetical protein [Butyrivibrio fibrisolvens]
MNISWHELIINYSISEGWVVCSWECIWILEIIDVLAALIHIGDLGYDTRTNEAYIPNEEVRELFDSANKKYECKIQRNRV